MPGRPSAPPTFYPHNAADRVVSISRQPWGAVGRSATIDAGMSVADSKVFLPASVEWKDHDVKAAARGAPAQLARCGA